MPTDGREMENIMIRTPITSRRTFLLGAGGAAAAYALPRAGWAATELPRLTVTRDPGCGCCGGWVAHVKAAGFPVEVVETADLAPLKARLGVPQALISCHTAEVAGYVIEGHVPAEAVRRLLAERPRATGLDVPGMPIGSPGMEVPGTGPETYAVVLFTPDAQRVFARYRGSQVIW